MDAEQVKQAGEHTLMGWEVYPDGLHETLIWVRDTYGDLPLYVTESGSSFEDSFDDSGAISMTTAASNTFKPTSRRHIGPFRTESTCGVTSSGPSLTTSSGPSVTPVHSA